METDYAFLAFRGLKLLVFAGASMYGVKWVRPHALYSAGIRAHAAQHSAYGRRQGVCMGGCPVQCMSACRRHIAPGVRKQSSKHTQAAGPESLGSVVP